MYMCVCAPFRVSTKLNASECHIRYLEVRQKQLKALRQRIPQLKDKFLVRREMFVLLISQRMLTRMPRGFNSRIPTP